MLRLISPRDMLESEKRYFETSGVPSIDIMERAARALTDAARARFPDARTVYIACGPGGNGGDGYACARMLAEAGKSCAIYATAPAKSPDAVENARRAAETGIPIHTGELPESAPDLWVDCIYGTGLSRPPEGFALDLLGRIHYHHFRGSGVIACDIPSGLNGQTGEAYPFCVPTDVTVTFQYAKHGLYLRDGLDMCGEIIVADVGFPEEAFPVDLIRLLRGDDLKKRCAPRIKRNMHKGSYGHLLIVAGSMGMAGAAALCAKAALRSGVGLVSVACPEEIVPILQIHAPCAMCVPLPEKGGAISADALPNIIEALKGKNAVAIGPGLRRRVPPEIIQAVLESGLSAVIDADALNIISENPDLKKLLKFHHIITPHPGEAARLLGRKCEDPVADARALAEMGPTAVLKGASRVICTGSYSGFEEYEGSSLRPVLPARTAYISTAGCSGMARGGSGDVLTGLMGGMLASVEASLHRRDIDLALLPSMATDAAACACEIHGLAGELAYEKYNRAMNAEDIIEFIPEVFKKYAD